jgi:hypothetical protein
MGEQTVWEAVRSYFSQRKVVKRKEYMEDINAKMELLDVYRLYLTQAGYLRTIKPGVYERVTTIPSSLTMRACYRIGYGKNR